MASGIIYIAIAGMWVAYFLPRWLHDRNEFSGKSVERYKSALRVVANASPAGSSGEGVIHTDLDHVAKVAQKLLRRRIIFTILTFSLVSTVVGGIMNSMPYLYVLLPATGILLYIAHVRRQTIADSLHRRRVEQLHRRSSGVSSANLAEVVTPKNTNEHWIPLSERELTGVVLLPKGSAENRNVWQPTAIPTPTYLSAPKAFTPKRVLDLTTPGAWTEEQERLAREALAAAAPSRDEIFDQQLAEEAVARLREAANE